MVEIGMHFYCFGVLVVDMVLQERNVEKGANIWALRQINKTLHQCKNAKHAEKGWQCRKKIPH